MEALDFIKSELLQKFSNQFPTQKTEITFGDLTYSFMHKDGYTLECVFEEGIRFLNGKSYNGKGISVQFICAEKTPKGYISSKKINVNINDKNDVTISEVAELLKFNTDAIKNTFNPFYAEHKAKSRNAAAWNFIASNYITDPYCTK
jgi:hypothetical protein